jgi:hypothetical protein
MRRRDFIGTVTAIAGAGAVRGDVPDHLWSGYDFGPGPSVPDRLNQGPFGIEQDEGWYTVLTTTPSPHPIRNHGTGLIGYTWEEGGPSLAARKGAETLEQHVEKLSTLPFVDLLYIRCDWRDVQQRPGRLDLHPVWRLTLDAARRRGLRVGFRVQLSSPNIQPDKLSLPDFLKPRVPLVSIGRIENRPGFTAEFIEPRYDHPEFQKAFRELNELLAAEFDGDPVVEFMDLMMYGFWGEGHTGGRPNPFPDYLTAEKTFVEMTRLQLEAWKRVALVVNTQPDISRTGNREVHDLAVRAGSWLRSDSIILDEPIQIEMLANRPPWLPVIMEDGYKRQHSLEPRQLDLDGAGVPYLERAAQLAIDLGANYWALWTESDNLSKFNERYPALFPQLRRRLGYRLRPGWVWQRKRYDAIEVITAISNDGAAGVPGVLRLTAESLDGRLRKSGCLDAGHPHGGRIRQSAFILPRDLFGQRIRLRAELETKGSIRKPVRWACAQPVDADGSIVVQLLAEKDPRWRKGV